VVECLIAAGAVVDKARTNTGAMPLYIAAERGHVHVVGQLLTVGGADVNLATTDDGSTPLLMAAQLGYEHVVARLIAAPRVRSDQTCWNHL